MKTLWRYFDAQCPVMNLHSPCGNIRGEAHHKCADEGADLLGGPQPPPLLLIQTFLPHTDKAHRYHYLPQVGLGLRHATIIHTGITLGCTSE